MRHQQNIRYSRHLKLPEIGPEGQKKLLASRVLVIGAGGLGSPLLLYLAAGGVGTLGIVDSDRVELSNLQRQIIHETADIGHPKTESARESLLDLNPDVSVLCHQERLDESNINRLIAEYDIIADGSDNFETRFLVNDHCHALRKTLVTAAIQSFSGQLATFKSYRGTPHPCYRCLYHDIPPPGTIPTCAENGVLSSVAGIMGAWQATEIIKELLNIGESLSGYLLVLDALAASVRKIKLPRDPACICCGQAARSSA